MIKVRDNNQLIATVIPDVGMAGENTTQMEQRITRSFNILADIPDDQLEAISNSTVPLNALMRWMEQQRRNAAH